MKKTIVVAVLAVLSGLIASCDSDRKAIVAPPECCSSALPMAVGNYWVYADTAWYSGVPAASLDTFTVVDYVSDSLGDWWVLSGSMLTLGDRIMIKGDSIYTLQSGETVNYAEREYIPPVDTPFTYSMILQGDLMSGRTVYELDSAVTTPAGTFSNLYSYYGNYLYNEPLRQFFKPGVGFVYHEQLLSVTGPSSNYARRTRLVEYHLE